MTFQEIKEDYAKGNGWKNWEEMYGAMVPHYQQLIYEGAARRYAKSKWYEACEAVEEATGKDDYQRPEFKP